MSRSSLPAIKEDAFSRIVKYMSNEESGVVLTAKEEQIMARWIYANGLLKERKFREDLIIDKIVEKFSVSKFTARNDISSARSLFVKLTKDLKKYALIHHIEDIQMQIANWKTDKSLAPLLPKMYDSLTKALAALPEEAEAPPIATPVVNYVLVKNQTINVTMAGSDALAAADALIEQERSETSTDFEIENDGPKS
jgi:hypothetical protein